VVKIDELRLRVIYHHLHIDYMKYNLMGVEKKDLEEVMMNNLTPILERYFADLAKFTELKDTGKTKIVSNLAKLQKKLTVGQIIKKYIVNAIWIVASRLLIFRAKKVLFEFDRRDQNEIIEKKKGEKIGYNDYFNLPKRKIWLQIHIGNMNLVLVHGAVDACYTRAISLFSWLTRKVCTSATSMTSERYGTSL
jgi:hypothetical protein